MKDSLALVTDWPYITSYSGVFTDPHSGHEIIYSGDPITHLRMRLFNAQGIAIHDVPLNSAVDSLDGIGSIALFHMDSLMVMAELGGSFLVLDRNGRVIRRQKIADEQCDANGDFYELYSSSSGPVLIGSKMYFETDWAGSCDDHVADWHPASELDYVIRYFTEATPKCKFCELDLSSSSSRLRFGACAMLDHLTDQPRSTFGTAHCVALNRQLFSFSPYSEYLHRIDSVTLNIDQRIPIPFSGGRVGITPPPITKADMDRDGDNIRFATKSYILTAAYDFPSRKYVVNVCHEVPENSGEDERGSFRNWSMIVLDSTFNKIGEHRFSGEDLSGGTLLGMKSGIWALSKRSGRQASREPKVFRRIELK